MVKRDAHTEYTTYNERMFIKSLGKNRTRVDVDPSPRKELLRKYLKAARDRVDWGNIDGTKIMSIVRQELVA